MFLANALSVRTVRSVMFVSVNDWRPGSSSAHMASRLHAPARPLGRSQLRMGDLVKAAGRGGRAMARTSSGGSDGKLEEGLEFFCRISGDWRKRGLIGSEPSTAQASMAQAFHGPSLPGPSFGLRPGPKRVACLISALPE